jgi:acyl-coenzyme A synthetase/AMP-(fatty) acid ligase
VGGNRVSTDAIAAVLRTHAAVAEAAVVAVEDAIWTTRLEGFVVLRTGETVDSKMLRNWLSQRLAPYELPRDIRIVDELKVDSSGKLSLQALRAAVRQEF